MDGTDENRVQGAVHERTAHALERISSSTLITRPVRTIAAGVFLAALALYGLVWVVALLTGAAAVMSWHR